jgi:hypothetical protein
MPSYIVSDWQRAMGRDLGLVCPLRFLPRTGRSTTIGASLRSRERFATSRVGLVALAPSSIAPGTEETPQRAGTAERATINTPAPEQLEPDPQRDGVEGTVTTANSLHMRTSSLHIRASLRPICTQWQRPHHLSFGCGSFMRWLDGNKMGHLTSFSYSRRGGSVLRAINVVYGNQIAPSQCTPIMPEPFYLGKRYWLEGVHAQYKYPRSRLCRSTITR